MTTGIKHKDVGDELTKTEFHADDMHDMGDSLQIPASYVIFKDGSTIKAKNGTTGEIDYSGADAATVIQDTIDVLPITGGRIFIKSGIYSISTTILLDKHSVTIEGESSGWGGRGAVLKLAVGANCDILEMSKNGEYGFNCIRDLCFVGDKTNNTSGNAILIHQLRDSYFVRLSIGEMPEAGIKSYPAGGQNQWNLWFSDLLIEHCNGDGILLDGSVGNVYNWFIRDCVIGFGPYGIHLVGPYATLGSVEGCILTTMSSIGIWIADITNVQILNNLSQGNTFDGIFVDGPEVSDLDIKSNRFRANGRAGININNGDYIFIKQNNVRGNTTAGITIVDGKNAHGKVFSNAGYTTENSGTAAIASENSTVVVDHGLSATPSIVTATGTDSEVSACWITNITPTQFTINVSANVTANRDVHWYAEV